MAATTERIARILVEAGLREKREVTDAERKQVGEKLRQLPQDIRAFPQSLDVARGAVFLMTARQGTRTLAILTGKTPLPDFTGERITRGGNELLLAPYFPANASGLRQYFPYTAPRLLGLKTAFGMGYRAPWGTGNVAQAQVARELEIPVILAQQSAREVERTGRSFRDVLDRGTWSAFEVHLTNPWGADADHLTNEEQVEEAVEAGFTYFTYDPSRSIEAQVGGKPVETVDGNALEEAFARAVPEEEERKCLLSDYRGHPIDIASLGGQGSVNYEFTSRATMQLAVKYYRAIQHALCLYDCTRKLKGKEGFEAELSIDETETETTLLAQVFISAELARSGRRFLSLAPRFVGNFEKAIDYYYEVDPASGKRIADTKEFEERLEGIFAVARHFGYKISVHSGSDKFGIYPLLAKKGRELIHLKTAGTTYVEEMKVVARYDPGLFREIYAYSRQQFEKDRATYHLTTRPERIPALDELSGEEIAGLLESGKGNDDLRQVIHVVYGSVLTATGKNGKTLFRDRCRELLAQQEEGQFQEIANHMKRHLQSLGLL